MKITDVRIGDTVCTKNGFPMTVVGIFTTWTELDNPESGTVYLDFADNYGDVLEEDVKDVRPVRQPLDNH